MSLGPVSQMEQERNSRPRPSFTEDQVNALIARVEGFILFLLKVANPDIEV